MTEVTIERGQNIIDITLQEHGNLEGLIDVLKINNLGLSDVLNPGEKLLIDETTVGKNAAARLINESGIKVATGLFKQIYSSFNESFNLSFAVGKFKPKVKGKAFSTGFSNGFEI